MVQLGQRLTPHWYQQPGSVITTLGVEMPDKPTVQRTCEQCRNPFMARPSQIAAGQGKFCSRRCSTARKNIANKVAPEIRFWKFVQKGQGDSDCWLWTGRLFGEGYGQFTGGDGVPVLAHRFSYEIHNGPFLAGLWVLHSCPGGDRKDCVNPAHLRLGTIADNAKDAMDRRQLAYGDANGSRLYPERLVRGQANKKAKLTEEMVRIIRSRYAQGDVTHAQLADEFSVNQTNIGFVIRRRTWKHVA